MLTLKLKMKKIFEIAFKIIIRYLCNYHFFIFIIYWRMCFIIITIVIFEKNIFSVRFSDYLVKIGCWVWKNYIKIISFPTNKWIQ